MGFMDMLGGLNSAAMAQAMEQAPKFFTAWTEFMQTLGRKLAYQENVLAGIEARLGHVSRGVDAANDRLILLMSVSNLTPELHDSVVAMANADPRNIEPQPLPDWVYAVRADGGGDDC
jgi:hypothetical protein